MTDLIDRLSKLDGPNEYINVEIALATDFWPKDKIDKVVTRENGEKIVWFTDVYQELCPDFTASVDAAITLARRLWPDVMYRVGNNGEGPDPNLYLGEISIPVEKQSDYFTGVSSTDAIALCIALLRAKEASKP